MIQCKKGRGIQSGKIQVDMKCFEPSAILKAEVFACGL